MKPQITWHAVKKSLSSERRKLDTIWEKRGLGRATLLLLAVLRKVTEIVRRNTVFPL